MPSQYRERAGDKFRYRINAEALDNIGHHIEVDGKICVFCQSTLEIGDEVVAVLEVSASQSLTLCFTINNYNIKYWTPLSEILPIASQLRSGKKFKICPISTHASRPYSCDECCRSPSTLFYHPGCVHCLELFRSRLYSYTQPLTLDLVRNFGARFKERWDLLFENPRFNWHRLDIECLRPFLPVGSDFIPKQFGKLPIELRQSITKSIILSSQPSKSPVVKAIILSDIARILFENPISRRTRLVGTTYANVNDTFGEVMGLDHLGIIKPESGPCPWYLHRSEMTEEQIKQLKIVSSGPFLALSSRNYEDYTFWDTPTIAPVERRTMYHSKFLRNKRHRDLNTPRRMRTINLDGKTGLTFFCVIHCHTVIDDERVMYTQIRAIHAHDTEDSSAIATYKSLPQSMHDEIMMIYVPLGQIDGIWVREDIGGLALILQTPHSEIPIGSCRRPLVERSYYKLASGPIESLVYSLPEDGHEIEVFGAVTKLSKHMHDSQVFGSVGKLLADDDSSPKPESYPTAEQNCWVTDCIETSASLENVRYVEVYEEVGDVDLRHCTGMLFTYLDGSKSCVGQRRVGLNTIVIRYNNPTHIYTEHRNEHPACRANEADYEGDRRDRFFFSNEVEDEKPIRKYLESWRKPGTLVQYELWREELMSKKAEMRGSLWWLVSEAHSFPSYDRLAYPWP